MRRKYKAIMTPKDMEGLRIFLCIFFMESPHLPYVYISLSLTDCRGLTVSAEEEKCSLKNHYMCAPWWHGLILIYCFLGDQQQQQQQHPPAKTFHAWHTKSVYD